MDNLCTDFLHRLSPYFYRLFLFYSCAYLVFHLSPEVIPKFFTFPLKIALRSCKISLDWVNLQFYFFDKITRASTPVPTEKTLSKNLTGTITRQERYAAHNIETIHLGDLLCWKKSKKSGKKFCFI